MGSATSAARTASVRLVPPSAPPPRRPPSLSLFPTAGILQIILHAPPALLSPHTAAISSTLAYLVSLQDRIGNWPSKARARHDDQDRENDLVQYAALAERKHGT